MKFVFISLYFSAIFLNCGLSLPALHVNDDFLIRYKTCSGKVGRINLQINDNKTVVSVSEQIVFRQKIIDSVLSSNYEDLSCNEVEYIYELFLNNQNKINDMRKTKAVILTEVSIAAQYSSIFEEFIIPKRPFKGLNSFTFPELSSLIDTNILSIDTNNVTHDMSIYDKLLTLAITSDTPNIPKVASNNYLWRLKNIGSQFPEDDSLNILKQWPAVEILTKESPSSKLQSCPTNGMDLVIWSPSLPIRVRLFHKSSSHIPAFQHMNGYDNLDLNISLHYSTFLSTGFPISNEETNEEEVDKLTKLPKFKEFDLTPNEYLYIPSNYLVSYSSKDHSTSASTYIAKACIVDASNLNTFRQSISHTAKVSKHYQAILQALNREKTTTVDIDFSMQRSPKDSNLFNITSLQSTSSGPDGDSFLTSQPVTPTVTLTDRKDRRKRQSSNNLKDWQDLSKWNMLISSLTLPRPCTPYALHRSRRTITLSWKSPFTPNANDRTTFGFNITTCQLQPDVITSSGTEEIQSVSEEHACFTVEAYKVFESAVKAAPYRVSVSNTSGDEAEAEGDTLIYSFTLEGLIPGTQYKSKVSTIFHNYESTYSDFSEVMTTVPLSPPSALHCLQNSLHPCITAVPSNQAHSVVLTFPSPIDDGGFPLLGYHVHARVDDHTHHPSMRSHWQWLGFHPQSRLDLSTSLSLTSMTISNGLLPNTAYAFKVQPCNQLGNASLSPSSNVIKTSFGSISSSNRPIVYGITHNKFDFHNATSWDEKVAYIFVNDEAQYLTLKICPTKSQDFEVWRCHWSPTSYDIEGEVIAVDPIYADEPIRNVRSLHGMIALVRRGRVPLATKVQAIQATGAIGILIVDEYEGEGEVEAGTAAYSRCVSYDQSCLPGAGRAMKQGFARLDPPKLWENVKIPVVFVLKEIGDAIASSMHSLRRINANANAVDDNTLLCIGNVNAASARSEL